MKKCDTHRKLHESLRTAKEDRKLTIRSKTGTIPLGINSPPGVGKDYEIRAKIKLLDQVIIKAEGSIKKHIQMCKECGQER